LDLKILSLSFGKFSSFVFCGQLPRSGLMHELVASRAQGNQVVLAIFARMAAELFVMNLQLA